MFESESDSMENGVRVWMRFLVRQQSQSDTEHLS